MDLRFIPVEKTQIYLLFYKPTKTDPFQNRLVAYFDGPFSHVEMAIPKRYGDQPWERTVWGSSIYQNEPVFFKEKTYKREGYISFAIEVTIMQVHKIISYCRYHATQETPFSKWAMYAAFFPIQMVHTDATFCSKHVALALQSAGVSEVEDINPALTTPSLLHRRLTSGSKAILQIVPSKMQQSDVSMRENGAMMRTLLAIQPSLSAASLRGGGGSSSSCSNNSSLSNNKSNIIEVTNNGCGYSGGYSCSAGATKGGSIYIANNNNNNNNTNATNNKQSQLIFPSSSTLSQAQQPHPAPYPMSICMANKIPTCPFSIGKTDQLSFSFLFNDNNNNKNNISNNNNNNNNIIKC